MSRRERDRSFEKALARHFASAPIHGAGPLCPDPETLAAYHENTLAPEELLSWKQHFVACPRCQELLKHLEVTDNVVLEALEPVEAAKPAALGAAARSSNTMMEARRSRLAVRWAHDWRWAVPAGALAAGLLVWMAVRPPQWPRREGAENQQIVALTPSAQETARTKNASPPAQNPGTPASMDARQADHVSAQSSSEGIVGVPTADASKTSQKGPPEKTALAASAANAETMVPPVPGRPRRDQNAASSEAERRRTSFYRYRSERPVAKSRAAEGESSALPDLKKDGATLSATAPLVPPALAQPNPPETTSTEPRESKALGAAVAGSVTPGREELPSARRVHDRVELRIASAQSSPMILAPDSRVRWRVGMAGSIERSADAGRSWIAQKSGVAADLFAGSAVSDQICWIIGRAGTILRTTDGGTHWVKLPSPSAQDLSDVRATDAQQAVIVDARTRRAYKTTDGGASWAPGPPE